MSGISCCYGGMLSADLLNVFTKSAYRRQGHAEKLVRMLLCEAKNRGVEKITLSCTEEGFALYQKLSFNISENQMELKL